MNMLRTSAALAALALAAAGCMHDGAKTDMAKTDMAKAEGKPMPMPAPMAEKTVMVGGAAMYPSKNIIENAVNSKDHTTLVAAVKAAGLVETLSGPGPFTVFAPTNAAFDKLPAGTVDTLLKPDMKPMLQKVLTYHVVAGRMTAAVISKAITAGGGKATLKTVEGEALTASMIGGKLTLTDAKGGMHLHDKDDAPSPWHSRSRRPATRAQAALRSQVLLRLRSLRLFDFGHGELAVDLIDIKLDLVAGLDLLDHRRIGGLEHHRHGGHVEVGDRAVLDGDLALRVVDLGDLAVDREGG